MIQSPSPLLNDDVSLRVAMTMFGQTNYLLVDAGTPATDLDVRYRDSLGARVRKQGWPGLCLLSSNKLGTTWLAVNHVNMH